ncbi:MAG: BamA/TamA family outer membrane protein [Flavisolibacter sp.]
MNAIKYCFIFLITGSLFWAGCSNTRQLPPHEKLYTGATLRIKGASSVREKKILDEDLEGLSRPKPNTKVLGMRIKLSIYNLFKNKKPKSFWGKLRDKYGEPPVLLSQVDLTKNDKVFVNHIQNKGYFRGQVSGDTVVRGKKASARYTVVAGPQYTINSVHFPADSSDLSLAISKSTDKTLLNEGDPFNLDVIKGERTRIDAFLKERGFYFFSPDYLLVKTDSTIGNHKVDLYLTVKAETPRKASQIYRINDIFIYSGYSLNTANSDTLKSLAQYYKGYYIIDRRQRFKPYLFEETMQFNRGDVYNRTEHNLTLNRLINLNLFKFVKNRFEPIGLDSPKLNAYYYLTPLPGKSLRAEAALITRSSNLNGSQFNISLINRNLFRAGAQMHLTAYIGSDVQFSGALKGYNTYRYGAEADYVIPRFVVPFVNLRKKGPYAPRTNIRLGYDILQRKDLYTLNSYRAEYGYTWKKSLEITHELFPISVSYVQPINVTANYDSLKNIYFGLTRAIEPNFILGSRYEYLFNQLANSHPPANSFYFDGIADLSGNIAGLLTGADAKHGDTVKIYNAPFAQYVKLETDFRYYRRVGLKSTWANRIDIGVGYPYGNSTQIPYIKQFFVGGNNSLRGFRSRSVGPGTYYFLDTTGHGLIPDQTGDIKLEMQTEFRPHISGPLYGALFLDAGNIWLKNDSTYTGKPGGQFTKDFLKQLAVDVGVGIRMDLTVFVVRLDVAFPIRKPWVVPPVVLNDINFKDQAWRRENIIYNLAIGYPF